MRLAIVYYSATGNVHALATAIGDGAAEAGAEVRMRRVAELAPEEAIRANRRSPDDDTLATARHQGRRLARIAAAVASSRPT